MVTLVTEFSRVCKQIVSQRKNFERDRVRSRMLLHVVDEIHNSSGWDENREHCQEVTRTMKEGSWDNMNLHIQKMREVAEQERKEKRQTTHAG